MSDLLFSRLFYYWYLILYQWLLKNKSPKLSSPYVLSGFQSLKLLIRITFHRIENPEFSISRELAGMIIFFRYSEVLIYWFPDKVNLIYK